MLKTSISKTYCGWASYSVTYDHASGKKNRYTVAILTADDPVVIGRELSLKVAREVIKDAEDEFYSLFLIGKIYNGTRRVALSVKRKLSK